MTTVIVLVGSIVCVILWVLLFYGYGLYLLAPKDSPEKQLANKKVLKMRPLKMQPQNLPKESKKSCRIDPQELERAKAKVREALNLYNEQRRQK